MGPRYRYPGGERKSLKIALFSPLNPVKTGISDYTEEMLLELSEYFDIDIYIDTGFQPENLEITSSFKVILFDPNSFDPSSYDEIVYHMGNFYEGHKYIFEGLKRFSGVVVLHDLVMQGFYAERYNSTGDFDEYHNLLYMYYGQKGGEIAQDVFERKSFPIWESDKALQFPLNEEIIEHAKALIVHSDFVRGRVQAKTDKPVVTIPHHSHELKPFNTEEIRAQLGVEPDEILICSAGFINKNKRFDRILPALQELKDIKFKLVIAGKDRGNLLENYLTAKMSYILVKGHLPIEELEGLISASDICINLRYPTMGESSGSLLRMMGYGKPTLVTNYGSYAEFPDYCVLKVDPDLDEKELIKRFVRALAEDSDFRQSVGREAKEYVQKECSIEKCAGEYARFIKEKKLSENLPRFS